MRTSAFFECPNCGNTKKFGIVTSNFQVISQSPEMGMRIDESDAMPNLREDDNYVECPLCSNRLQYDTATDIGRRYLHISKKLSK